MFQEMQIRNYSPHTIRTYLSLITHLSLYYKCSPGELSIDQVKRYLFYCIKEKHLSVSTINQIISAVKILFKDILGRKWEPLNIKRPRREKRLPVVMSKEEVAMLISGTENIKHKAIFSTAYSTGMRLGEVLKLKFNDIDAARMQVRVQLGKGNKSRMTLLSSKLLVQLREYYKIYRPVRYLFEGSKIGEPLSYGTVRTVLKINAKRAGIT
jgi:site-specific recombinase XerD